MSIHAASAFPDLLDPRFMQVSLQAYDEETDRIPEFYTKKSSNLSVERWSEISDMGDAVEFLGTIEYDAATQGYDAQASPKIFNLGTQIQRELWELEQFDIIDKLHRALGRSIKRRMQKDAARIFNNGFSIDNFFGSHTEGVALLSNSHTTTRPGVSTATGFDNVSTSAFSPTALTASITQFRQFRSLTGEPSDKGPTHILVPIELEDRAKEVLQTREGLDAAEGNINVHHNRLTLKSWYRLTDANNWFLYNEPMMKENLYWFQVFEPEFSRMESFDTVVAKYRGLTMYSLGRADWRWILGHQVS